MFLENVQGSRGIPERPLQRMEDAAFVLERENKMSTFDTFTKANKILTGSGLIQMVHIRCTQ